MIGLLLVRGLGSVLSSTPEASAGGSAERKDFDPASAAFAVRFARAYLSGGSTEVAQAEVAGTQRLGQGREILTVACELRDARTLYLAVPISRSEAGGVAALGAPWMVAAPSTAGVATERPRPVAGADATAIRTLAAKFVPAYLSARSSRAFSYLLAPGSVVVPLGGSLEPVGRPGIIAQLGDGEGRRRTIVLVGRFRDSSSGAVYRLAYRIEVERRQRWYVQAVEGALP